LADPDLTLIKPGPLIGEWDGQVWWLNRVRSYQFDCDVRVISTLRFPSSAS